MEKEITHQYIDRSHHLSNEKPVITKPWRIIIKF